MRKRSAIQIGILSGVIAVGYFVYEGRVSTRRIGPSYGSAPSCRLDIADVSSNTIKVGIEVSNPTNTPIGIPKRFLPQWGRVYTKLFDVDRNGTVIEFTGRFIDTKSEDMVQIEPGTAARIKISLTDAGYDVKGHGRFTVTYRTVVWSGGTAVDCTSNALVINK